MGVEKKDKFDFFVRTAVALIVLLVISKLLWINLVQNKLSDYLLAETLLFYPGEYIRRSLLGNFFLPFPVSVQKGMVILFYSLLVFMLLIYALKYCRDKYLLLLFLCLPFGIRIYLSENNGLYRKELLFFLVIILTLQLYRFSRNMTVNLVVSILASILMIMIHESFVFLAAPVVGWIIYRNNAGLLGPVIYFLVTGLSFLLLSGIPNEQQIATLDQFFLSRQIDWSLSKNYLVMSREKTLGISFSHFTEGSIWFYLLFFLPVISYMFYARIIKKEFILLLAFQAFVCLVLCMLAMDYGRWLSFMLVSFFLCLFTYSNQHDFSLRIKHSLREKVVYLALLFFVCSIHIPNFVESYPLKRNIADNLIWNKITNAVNKKAADQH